MYLNRSRSMTSSAIARSPEAEAKAWSRRSRIAVRLASPVSGIESRLSGDARFEQRRAQRQRVGRRRNEQRQDRGHGDAQRAPADETRIAVEIGRRRDDGERRIGDRGDVARSVAA